MSGALSGSQAEQYQETGQVGPVPILSAEGVAYYRSKIEAAEAALGDPLSRVPGQFRAKTNLLYTWMDELVRYPGILDAIESLIGPDILLYHLTCWIKEPGDSFFVSWHQDSTYFNLTPAEHVTAWVALSDATPESGCMRMRPGSHRTGQQDHEQGPTVGICSPKVNRWRSISMNLKPSILSCRQALSVFTTRILSIVPAPINLMIGA